MTPAERLIAAADLLAERAAAATPELTIDVVEDDLFPEDVDYIATMNPEVGKALAVVLRTEGVRISGTAALAVAFDGSPLHPARPDLLTLADLLLAGAS